MADLGASKDLQSSPFGLAGDGRAHIQARWRARVWAGVLLCGAPVWALAQGMVPGVDVSRDELIAFYDGKTAKWQIPDDVVFVDSIPLGATGKMLKTKLRETLKDYKLPVA